MAAKDHDSHIEALGALAEFLSDEQNRNTLLNGGNSTQIEHLLQGILGE
jgi:mannitol/fructose-specific phosphotransferase system IIA component (Ntr-type)